MAEVEARVRQIIKEVLQMERDYSLDETLAELGADSLDDVELVMAAEEEFNIAISDEDGEKIKTVRQMVDYLTAREIALSLELA